MSDSDTTDRLPAQPISLVKEAHAFRTCLMGHGLLEPQFLAYGPKSADKIFRKLSVI